MQKRINQFFYILTALIALLLFVWWLLLYDHSQQMKYHPATMNEGLGLVMGICLAFLFYLSPFYFWALIVKVEKAKISDLSLKIQGATIFLLAVIPTLFALVMSIGNVRNPFRDYNPSFEYYDQNPPTTDGVFKQFYGVSAEGDTLFRSTANYQKGKRHGRQTLYYPSGMIWREGYYHTGRLDSFFAYFDLENNPLRLKMYYCYDKDGKMHGKQIETRVMEEPWKNDTLSFTPVDHFFSHGVLDSSLYFNKENQEWVKGQLFNEYDPFEIYDRHGRFEW